MITSLTQPLQTLSLPGEAPTSTLSWKGFDLSGAPGFAGAMPKLEGDDYG
jgi:hypothetical protein